ncbi:TrmH family RNA methyltransferase [Blastopirellula retiformator]|nr:RNA methyltransferase [Blastopirellula retiformator]
MSDFEHLRHKPPTALDEPRQLIVACCQLRSNVNLSRIVRTASCCAVSRVIVTGNMKIDPKIARDGAEQLPISRHRSLPPVLRDLKKEGYRLVGLEQTTNSVDIHHFSFVRNTVLVIGNERQGTPDDVLRLLDDVVEIPVYGMPYSFNVATATSMALYEFCRQFPTG